MKTLSLKEENIIRDKRNLLRLKSIELNYNAIKDIRNVFRQKKKLKQLKKECLEVLRILLSIKKRKLLETSKNK